MLLYPIIRPIALSHVKVSRSASKLKSIQMRNSRNFGVSKGVDEIKITGPIPTATQDLWICFHRVVESNSSKAVCSCSCICPWCAVVPASFGPFSFQRQMSQDRVLQDPILLYNEFNVNDMRRWISVLIKLQQFFRKVDGTIWLPSLSVCIHERQGYLKQKGEGEGEDCKGMGPR